MKTLMLLFIFSSICFARLESENTKKTIYHPFEVFSHARSKGEDSVKVKGIGFFPFARAIEKRYVKSARSYVIPESFFKFSQSLAQSVFEAFPKGRNEQFGSAVHAGDNLILTAQHVLSVGRDNTKDCRRFTISLNSNQKRKTLKCKKVHFCNKDLDYCLIEMKDHRRGQSLIKQAAPVLNTEAEYGDNVITVAIGNPIGFGLHASSGITLEKREEDMIFYAPVFSGNSGGALFNESGEVIGIVKAQSAELRSEKAYNVALSLKAIREDLEKNLGKDSEVLQKINFK